jgi:hypothetical protein
VAVRYDAAGGRYVDEPDLERLTLEAVLTSPEWFGLEQATPLQRAICRIADGLELGELAEHDDVVAGLGGPEAVAALPAEQPAELYVLAGIRAGKSLTAAALGVRASQVCDVSSLRDGEVPRVSIVSLKLDLAQVVYQHLCGAALGQTRVAELLMAEPTADSVMLRHPSGRPVEIKVVAGARAGASLVARWSAGAIFDEFPRMVGADEGVVNFDDAKRAVMGRMLPGAQIVGIGSPWAPFGPAYKLVKNHHGKPSADCVVVRGTGPAMNPAHWTPAACEDLLRRDPITHRTDVLGEFADAESSLFGSWELDSLVRRSPVAIEPRPGLSFAAAIDPAATTDAFSLVVVTRVLHDKWGDVLSVAMARTWEPPLSPDEVLGEIATLLRPYGVTTVATDQWSAAALRDLGRHHGLTLEETTLTAALKVDLFESLRTLVADRRIELAPNEELLEDLRRVRKKILESGGWRIYFPRVGGRHCDLASAMALACAQPVAAPTAERAPTFGEARKLAYSEKLRREAERDWE